MLTIITTQSSTLEGSRLQKQGRVSASILACTNTLQSNSELKWTQVPGEVSSLDWPIVASFIGKSYDVTTRPVMSQIRHGMMSLVTPFHNVTSWWCKQLCAPTDAARQQACVCEKWIMFQKNTHMSHPPPHVFGSALTSRAFNRFNVQWKYLDTHDNNAYDIKLM